MKRLAVALMVMSASATGLAAQSPADEEGVRQVVTALFDYMKQGDAEAMATLLHRDARLVTTAVRDGVPVSRIVDVEGWLQSVGSSERELDERLHDVEVRVCGPAMISTWTGYTATAAWTSSTSCWARTVGRSSASPTRAPPRDAEDDAGWGWRLAHLPSFPGGSLRPT